MLNDLVSVVIPTRHRLALLQRALISAMEQTYRPLEIIVVVDGVDRETELYLGGLADTRVRVHALSEPRPQCRRADRTRRLDCLPG